MGGVAFYVTFDFHANDLTNPRYINFESRESHLFG